MIVAIFKVIIEKVNVLLAVFQVVSILNLVFVELILNMLFKKHHSSFVTLQ